MSFRRTLPPRVKSIPQRGTGRGVISAVGDAVVAQQKGVKCKPGKQKPTKEEAEWMDRIVRLGCIVCWNEGRRGEPPDVHHILSGGRRMGHLFTIPLCPGHHRGGVPGMIARHPWKARFEAAYGYEIDLLAWVKELA